MLPPGDEVIAAGARPAGQWRAGMNRGVIFGCGALLAALGASAAAAQTPLERGRYLVDTVMTCHNCHTPMGPNGPQFDKALSGGCGSTSRRST